MKTYSEKLRDPRWGQFRDLAFSILGSECEQCGLDYKRPNNGLQVHHKRYIKDREPWEYDIADVSILCGSCHQDVHNCETIWRDLIRALPPWATVKMAEMGETIARLDPHSSKICSVKAHSAVKSFLCARTNITTQIHEDSNDKA